MVVPNRMVMAPMVTNFAEKDGHVTDRLKSYYAERARGGVGLIIVEATCVDAPTGKHRPGMLCIDHDRYLPGLKDLVKAIKAHGARIAVQLEHTGSMARKSLTGVTPVSASAVPLFPGRETPRELTTAEVEEIVVKYGEAAARAREAGFDAVEVLTGYYYLLGQFLSPVRNLRRDRYGGSLEGRLRLTTDIIAGIRARAGRDFPIICKLSAPIEGVEDDKEIDQVMRLIEQAGSDMLHRIGPSPVIRLGSSYSALTGAMPMRVPRGYAVDLAGRARQVVSIPVMAVGRINRPELAESILESGKADLIGLGRALLADPEFPRKALEDRAQDIRPCIACCRGCISRVKASDLGGKDPDITCTVNPALGKEEELRIRPAGQSRRVLVVGGGPAGMAAAQAAALHGHRVWLYEARDRLGGQAALAALPPGKAEIQGLIDYLGHQLARLGVEVRLGQRANPDTVAGIRPDAVIVATGALPAVPAIPGLENAVTAFDVLEGQAKTGGNVTVVGGGVTGCETAEYLAGQGKKVTIVEMLPEIATSEVPVARYFLLQSLDKMGVRVLAGAAIEEVDNGHVSVHLASGERENVETDTLVIAAGMRPDRDLAAGLAETGLAVQLVGDCTEPRHILEAIREGYAAGLDL